MKCKKSYAAISSVMLALAMVSCGIDDDVDTTINSYGAISIISQDSIAGMLLFDEGAGNITKDSSGYGFHGLLHGNVKWVNGKFGKGLEFHGDDYIQLKDSEVWLAFEESTPFSITAWVNYYNTAEGGGTIVSKYNGGVIGSYILEYGEYLEIAGFSREAAPWRLNGNIALPAGQFSHIAATYDGKEMRIYVNGTLDVKQESGAQVTDLVTPVLIGARFTDGKPSNFFRGIIDEVIFFNIALDDDQISEVMEGMSVP